MGNKTVYLDNCTYNRPFDDQSHLRISLETQAKLYIQSLIKDNQIPRPEGRGICSPEVVALRGLIPRPKGRGIKPLRHE